MGLNGGWVYRERVGRDGVGQVVLEYYSQRYRHSSPEEWRRRILVGQVLVDGQGVSPDAPLRLGQWLTYHRPPWDEPDVPLDLTVLYEDADLVVVAKPSGLPVLPGGGFLAHTLLGQLQRRYDADPHPPVPIHRLGRGTSGLLLLARSPLARSDLTRQMRDRQIQKIYRALVGVSSEQDLADQFTITQPIGKCQHPLLGHVYGAVDHDTHPSECLTAHSQGRVLHRSADQTLVEVTIQTGRPHQIRIHLAAIGYPLVGDPLYRVGGKPRSDAVPGDCGYHLHAYHIGFTHPRTRQWLEVTCAAPNSLLAPWEH